MWVKTGAGRISVSSKLRGKHWFLFHERLVACKKLRCAPLPAGGTAAHSASDTRCPHSRREDQGAATATTGQPASFHRSFSIRSLERARSSDAS